MNDNNTPKKFDSLSEQLSDIFENMDQINATFKKIESYVEQKYKDIERDINPENNRDISKELQYHTAKFLHSLANDFEKKKLFI